jgi:hypothetical protein
MYYYLNYLQSIPTWTYSLFNINNKKSNINNPNIELLRILTKEKNQILLIRMHGKLLKNIRKVM